MLAVFGSVRVLAFFFLLRGSLLCAVCLSSATPVSQRVLLEVGHAAHRSAPLACWLTTLTECSETAPDADVEKSVHGVLQVVMPFACVWHRLPQKFKLCRSGRRSPEGTNRIFRPPTVLLCTSLEGVEPASVPPPVRRGEERQDADPAGSGASTKRGSSTVRLCIESGPPLSRSLSLSVCSAAALSRKLTRGCCNQSLEWENVEVALCTE